MRIRISSLKRPHLTLQVSQVSRQRGRERFRAKPRRSPGVRKGFGLDCQVYCYECVHVKVVSISRVSLDCCFFCRDARVRQGIYRNLMVSMRLFCVSAKLHACSFVYVCLWMLQSGALCIGRECMEWVK